MEKKIVIIPTYNEKENIKELISHITGLNLGFDIVVVDDNSPDGTSDIVEGIRKEQDNVYLIKREGKLGLGTAYKAGMRFGIEKGYDFIFTMDSDFSHDPKYLPDFLPLLETCDIVIGSRYVPGGGTKNWGINRQILSKTANMFAKLMLGLKSNDNTAGFRAYRRKVLETIDLNNILSDGYSFLVEMLYNCQSAGFKVGETPIIFADREAGQSKISKTEIRKAIIIIFRLKFKKIFGM